jgi:hypothetical protein
MLPLFNFYFLLPCANNRRLQWSNLAWALNLSLSNQPGPEQQLISAATPSGCSRLQELNYHPNHLAASSKYRAQQLIGGLLCFDSWPPLPRLVLPVKGTGRNLRILRQKGSFAVMWRRFPAFARTTSRLPVCARRGWGEAAAAGPRRRAASSVAPRCCPWRTERSDKPAKRRTPLPRRIAVARC